MFDPAKLVFIDETCTSTDMVRQYGRSPRGERLIGYAPEGHRKTITFIAGLRQNGMTAPGVIDGAMNGPIFVGYVEQILVPTLKRGDIVTHMYAPAPNGILDDNGRVFPEVLAARRRGIWFDFGNGVADHFNWDVVERCMKQGFTPDTFSTDWNPMSRTTGVIDFPNVMSKFLMFGMPLDQVIARATVNAARVLDALSDRGTLNVGAPADIGVLELRDG